MSAMHWEARRRQHVLDRRMASRSRQGLTADMQKQSSVEKSQSETPVTSSVSSEPLVADKKILCSCQLEKREQYSAKIDNRYTSIQYSQQW
ncbi:coiled-coil domain-containing protein 200 [Astyanax mexicanus]|uniref:Coiled-coil domain-containing protein 200 n=1 Tax=Astyanax mexicanus TaxID=7994 RepID=A0A8T2L9X2_ASTMX|nr:coiled-coil domain-containing protein 200 [Astyanax mexicanus]